MLFRIGRTFHHDHLDMNVKLDLILKELQNLKLKIEGLKK